MVAGWSTGADVSEEDAVSREAARNFMIPIRGRVLLQGAGASMELERGTRFHLSIVSRVSHAKRRARARREC